MDRNRRERTSPATSNRMFHPAGATSFPCARVVLLLAGKIRFFAAPGHSAGAVLQRTCGPRCRYSIQTTSLSSPVRHEAVRSGAKAHDMIRRHAEHAIQPAAVEIIQISVGPGGMNKRRRCINSKPKCVFGRSGFIILKGLTRLHAGLLTCSWLNAYQGYINARVSSIAFALRVRTWQRTFARPKTQRHELAICSLFLPESTDSNIIDSVLAH